MKAKTMSPKIMVNVTVSLVGCQQDILLDMDILLNQNIWQYGNYFVISKGFFQDFMGLLCCSAVNK